jgi:hypothetical protein
MLRLPRLLSSRMKSASARAAPGEPADDECSARVAAGHTLDFDDVGAPVRQCDSCRGYVRPRRQLDDPNATEHA